MDLLAEVLLSLSLSSSETDKSLNHLKEFSWSTVSWVIPVCAFLLLA
jgi:hypothetical protein